MKLFRLALLFVLAGISVYSQNVTVSPVEFNSSDDDFASCPSQNGNKIFFTSGRSGSKQKIFTVERTATGWAAPEKLGSEVNAGSQNGSVAVTPDGQYIIFAAIDHSAGSEGRTDLYSARKVRGEWTDVQNLGPAINSPYWDSQPSLSSDGMTLFFTSDRPGGQGGTDIYYSRKTREGWTKAVNAGSAINSSSDDISPVIGPDNKTFYFASNRSGGQGGFDIYVAQFANGNFGNVKAAAAPINSEYDEVFYYSLPNSNVAYFSSDRPGGNGGLDVYTAIPNPYQSEAVVLVGGKVKDSKTGEALGANIIITDLKTKKKVAELRSDDETGQYYVVLVPGRTYSITASKKGYIFFSEKYEVPESEKGHEITKDIVLSKSDTRLLLNFDFDKSTLKDESFPELDNVIEYLNENPTARVRFEGHTDDVGDDNYNLKLSKDRAAAVKAYLVNAGISESRIETEGYGETRPLIKETTDAARAMNRRVEMKIIE